MPILSVRGLLAFRGVLRFLIGRLALLCRDLLGVILLFVRFVLLHAALIVAGRCGFLLKITTCASEHAVSKLSPLFHEGAQIRQSFRLKFNKELKG